MKSQKNNEISKKNNSQKKNKKKVKTKTFQNLKVSELNQCQWQTISGTEAMSASDGISAT